MGIIGMHGIAERVRGETGRPHLQTLAILIQPAPARRLAKHHGQYCRIIEQHHAQHDGPVMQMRLNPGKNHVVSGHVREDIAGAGARFNNVASIVPQFTGINKSI